jgi:hypothetical protein
MHICVTRDGQEDYAVQELKELPTASPVKCTRLAPGVVELSECPLEGLSHYPLLFTRQMLPNSSRIEAASIRLWAQAISQRLIESLSGTQSSWALHIFEPRSAETGEQYF